MPNDPRFYETSFIYEGNKVVRTFADMLLYDKSKRGENDGEKFWCLQVLVHEKRIVDHASYSAHRVSDIIRAVKKMDPSLQNMRVWIYKYSAESDLESKADNRPPTETEPAGIHSNTRLNNTLANGDPKPLDPNWVLPRGYYPAMVYSPYPDQVEFDIYYEANDEHIMLLLPYGNITVATVKEALYKFLYPDHPAIEGKYLGQMGITYSGAIGTPGDKVKLLPDKKKLSYQDYYPSEGSGGIYGCRLYTPTGEVYSRGEAAEPRNNERPDIVQSLNPMLNKYEDEAGNIEGIDVQKEGINYMPSGFVSQRRSLTDLQPWDVARIPYIAEWKATLADEVYKYFPDRDSTTYKTALIVTSANCTVRFNWASARRGDPLLDATPSEADYPLRLSRASKMRRTS